MPSTAAQAVRDAALRPALLSHVRERRCVLFVGAGLSRPAGYPGWRGLMEAVVQETTRRSGDDAAAAELKALLDAGRYAELADQCRETLGRTLFTALLRKELARPVTPPEATHRPIVQTPYSAIVTTNFDTLLEDAYALWSDEGIPKAPTGAELGRHGTLLLDRAFFVLKAHGTIHDEASLVFTSEDYRRITHANPAFQSMMAAILLSHAIVFVGYSLSDPNFRLLLESQLSVFGAQAPPRYAVMEGVGALEAQIMRRTAGIEIISYPRGAHDNVAMFLEAIAAQTRPRASRRPPRRTVLRRAHPLPALHLAIRPHGAMLDVEWFETTTADLAGVGVPLERRWTASAVSLPWLELSRTAGNLATTGPRAVGALLARPFEALGIPLVVEGDARLVVLDVPRALAGLPWEWMLVNGEPLCLQAPLCRMVPGSDDASRGRPFFHSPLRVLVVGDALAESRYTRHPLPGTREEAEAIRDRFLKASPGHEVTVLVGRQASYERVLREIMDGYDIVHMTGAAYVDPLGESVVPLHDGHVSASELATLLIRNPPGLLFVNEDHSGFVPVIGDRRFFMPEGGEAFDDFYHRLEQHRPGLERVVARAGVGTFIGCMAPATESVARDIAVAFYEALLAGLPVSQALFRARSSVRAPEDNTPLMFAMEGYADARVTPDS
jgi:hypothetical protein